MTPLTRTLEYRTFVGIHGEGDAMTVTSVSEDYSFLDRGLGWIPDLPDFRDFTVDTPLVAGMLARTSLRPSGKSSSKSKASASNAPSVDLRANCPPIEDQGTLGSCTANAAVGVLEYFARASFGKYDDLSRLFVYKVTREMMGWTGDTGAFLRSAMGAIASFGAPPEKYWPYDIAKFEDEPSSFAYAYAQNYKAATYYRLDPPGTSALAKLDAVKTHLVGGLPSMFGFSVYSSYSSSGPSGKFPFPAAGEKQEGGHAVVAVGYDDAIQIVHPSSGAKTKGALLIRNSWGTGWGMAGYGWLPYEYLLQGLAEDFWVVVKAEWIDSGQFAETVV
jgi:C1A family cysteine protease